MKVVVSLFALAITSLVVGKLVARPRERIPGGLASGKSPRDFDPVALAQGIRVEMEHTTDREIAQEIAMDHLAENPNYYDLLKKAGL